MNSWCDADRVIGIVTLGIASYLNPLLQLAPILNSIDTMQAHFLADSGSGNAEAAVREAMQYGQSRQTNAEQR